MREIVDKHFPDNWVGRREREREREREVYDVLLHIHIIPSGHQYIYGYYY